MLSKGAMRFDKPVHSIKEMFEAMRGGDKSVKIIHFFDENNELMSPTRLCAQLELEPGAQSQVLPPLEGEEFGYVLRGQITLVHGKKRMIVRKGGSFCLHPSATHQIENSGSKPAAVLWVSTPPSF